ncbi:Hypothetical protein, putative [Bodo saltans]|uniref:Uncharacterized protein n=1 Tax=Bodo saltans TaxID=75058 RepID=A0A0S4JHM7_BODSA|nr:Hypothetical protein, putative [Bodo saltans]|eukprot:CUG90996.1 Hypothetical protein, putative [Bodo saltans]
MRVNRKFLNSAKMWIPTQCTLSRHQRLLCWRSMAAISAMKTVPACMLRVQALHSSTRVLLAPHVIAPAESTATTAGGNSPCTLQAEKEALKTEIAKLTLEQRAWAAARANKPCPKHYNRKKYAELRHSIHERANARFSPAKHFR